MNELVQAVLAELIADLILKGAKRFWSVTGFTRRTARDEVVEVDMTQVVGASLKRSDFIDISASTESNEDKGILAAFARSKEMETLVWDFLSHSMTGGDAASDSSLDYTRWCLMLYGMAPSSAARIAKRVNEYVWELLKIRGPILAALPSTERSRKTREQGMHKTIASASNDALARLATFMDRETVTIKSLEATSEKLRSSIVSVHGNLRPANIESHALTPVMDLYVPQKLRPANFQAASLSVVGAGQSSSIGEIVATNPRVVILGDPGAGKSTVSELFSWSLASGDEQEVSGWLAIPLILRGYGQQIRADRGIDVIGALRSVCLHLYQVALSRDAVEYLCVSGRLGVIFDGLDEILDAEGRRDVANSITAFSNQYSRANVIVTSRKVGYGVASLPEQEFGIFEILPFDDVQITTYAQKWFLRVTPSTQAAYSLAAAFIRESAENIRDIRDNPLLLSLLCSLYRRRTSLPRNRPAIYEACAELMFDTWDRSRSLRPRFEFENHIDGAIQEIAWWIFGRNESVIGVSEGDLVDRAARYFRDWQFADMATARRSARDFVDHCKGRAWILSDLELTEGDVRFGFTHRTFLEYFAAKYLCQSRDSQAVIDFVVLHSNDSRWYMVCLLALQISGSHLGVRDEAAETLAANEPAVVAEVSYRQLCASILESIPLKPSSVEAMARVSLQPVLDVVARAKRYTPLSSNRLPAQGWVDGSRVAVENYRAVAGFIKKYLASRPDEPESVRQLIPLIMDLLINEICSPNDFREILDCLGPKMRMRIIQSIYGEARAEVSAMMLQITSDLVYMEGTLIGNVGPQVVSPVKSVWGLRHLPNGVEAFLWVLSEYSQENEKWLTDVGAVLQERVPRAIVSRLRQSWRFGYQPSPLWAVIGGPSIATSKAPEALLAIGARFTLGLLELLEPSATRFDLEFLARQSWGMLPFIGPMIARRHGLPEEMQSGVSSRVRELGLESWYQDKRSVW